MFDISFNGTITVNRGDSFEYLTKINLGTNLFPDYITLTDKDIVYFAVMEPNQPFETALIKKKLNYKNVDEDGNLVVRFKPQDTQCVLPGKYYYQIKLQRFRSDDPSDYTVDTLVDKTLFWVLE